jgi:hypothetical protein
MKHSFRYTIGGPFNVQTVKPYGALSCTVSRNEVWDEIMPKGVT